MGGLGSGNHGGRPTANMCQRIDVAWMIRTKRLVPDCLTSGTLSWSCGGSPAGAIGFQADMTEQFNARLTLNFAVTRNGERQEVRQTVHLSFTEPTYGGRRWWLHCPITGRRVGKLYKPLGGDRFACRQAWRLGYQSQRDAKRDRPFEQMFRLQRKLGGDQGYDMGLRRPKGMWRRTYERHLAEYERLAAICDVEMMRMIGVLRRLG